MIKSSRIAILGSLGNFSLMEPAPVKAEDVDIFDDVTIARHELERAKMINAHRNRYRKMNGSVLCPICRLQRISSNADCCLGCKQAKEAELNAAV